MHDTEVEENLATIRRAVVKANRQARDWATLAHGLYALVDGARRPVEADNTWAARRRELSDTYHAMVQNGVLEEVRAEDAKREWEWDFTVPEGHTMTLSEAIGQAMGGASMCWVGGTGDLAFDSGQAAVIFNKLMAWIKDNHPDMIREDQK